MGDRLRAGIPSRYVTSQLGQLSLESKIKIIQNPKSPKSSAVTDTNNLLGQLSLASLASARVRAGMSALPGGR